MGRLKIFFRELALYGKAPELKLFWLTFGLIGILLMVDVFFLPIFLIWVSIILFLSVMAIISVSYLKIARSNQETKIKSRELQSVIENLDAGIIGYDPNFRIINFNKTAENIFGVSAQEIIGQYVDPNFVKNPHFRQLTQVVFPSLAPVVNVISEPSVWPQVVDITLEEPTRELRTALSRLTDDKGNLLGFFKIIRDRTREKSLLRSKSEFISIAAHQMRTPLSAINWAFESLIKLTEDKERLETMKSGYEAVQRALKTVNDLLDVSKIEEGKYGYNFENADLGEFIQTILAQFKPIVQQYQVNIYLTLPKEKLTVRIDPQKLSIAFSNLIDNAIKYNVKNGKVEILVEKLENQPFIKISVTDTGVGIPANEMEGIFKKFYRGSNVIQLEPNGSGLGLYITKNIIQQHGGKIDLESVPDRGSTFYFTLPIDFSLIPTKEVAGEEP